MKGFKGKTSIVLAVLIFMPFLISACIGFSQRRYQDPFNLKTSGLVQYPVSDARAVFSQIQLENRQIKTIKGIGTFHLDYQNGKFSSRLAWTGIKDGNKEGKIRLEVMGPHGQPTASFATDDRTLYFFSHVEKKFYKKGLTDNSLKKYLNIPITVDEMIDLLSGRIPMDEYDQVALTENPFQDGRMLHIFKKGKEQVVRLFIDGTDHSVYKAEFFHSYTELDFSVTFFNRKLVDTYKIPFQISIVDGKGSDCRLKMDRVWINTDVDETIFSLTRPR